MIVYVCYTIDDPSLNTLGSKLLASSIDAAFQDQANAMEFIIAKRNSGVNCWFVQLPVEDRKVRGYSEAKRLLRLLTP